MQKLGFRKQTLTSSKENIFFHPKKSANNHDLININNSIIEIIGLHRKDFRDKAKENSKRV